MEFSVIIDNRDMVKNGNIPMDKWKNVAFCIRHGISAKEMTLQNGGT